MKKLVMIMTVVLSIVGSQAGDVIVKSGHDNLPDTVTPAK